MPNNLQASLAPWGLTLFCSIFVSLAAMAQGPETAEADAAFERRGYFLAADEYTAAYAKIKTDVNLKGYCAFRAGEAYRLHHKNKSAKEWYDKAIGLKYGDQEPDLYLSMGDALRSLLRWDEAIEMYQKYRQAGGSKRVSKERIESTDYVAILIEEADSRYVLESLPILNDVSYDYTPVITGKNDNEVIFASSRESSAGSNRDKITGEAFADLFMSEIDKKDDWATARWSEPVPLSNTICTEHQEGAPCLDSEGKMLYFMRCRQEGETFFPCEIYYAKKQGTRWGASEQLNIINRELDDSSRIGHPTLSPDDNMLVFASNMPGGQGGTDLWYLEARDGSFEGAIPQNLGPEINTPGNEQFPFYRDNGSLYWATDAREGGYGGWDIWMARGTEESMTFGEPEMMPYPINSVTDDFAITFRPGKDEGMFTSNREEGDEKGLDDLYMFYLPPISVCMQADVYDQTTGNTLTGAKLHVVCAETGEEIDYDFEAEELGGQLYCDGIFKAGQSYSVTASFDGYLTNGVNFNYVGVERDRTLPIEFPLQEAVLAKDYDMPQVLFPFGSAELLIDETVNSADSLTFLIDLLERNENLIIKVKSHTDSRGTASDNLKLSQQRAETCVNYLVENGIPMARLRPEGFGETQLLVSDAEIAKMPKDEQENAHQINRRTVFEILSFDYKPED